MEDSKRTPPYSYCRHISLLVKNHEIKSEFDIQANISKIFKDLCAAPLSIVLGWEWVKKETPFRLDVRHIFLTVGNKNNLLENNDYFESTIDDGIAEAMSEICRNDNSDILDWYYSEFDGEPFECEVT